MALRKVDYAARFQNDNYLVHYKISNTDIQTGPLHKSLSNLRGHIRRVSHRRPHMRQKDVELCKQMSTFQKELTSDTAENVPCSTENKKQKVNTLTIEISMKYGNKVQVLKSSHKVVCNICILQ